MKLGFVNIEDLSQQSVNPVKRLTDLASEGSGIDAVDAFFRVAFSYPTPFLDPPNQAVEVDVLGMTGAVAQGHEGIFIINGFVVAVSAGWVCLNQGGFLFLGVKGGRKDALPFGYGGLFEDLVVVPSGFGSPSQS